MLATKFGSSYDVTDPLVLTRMRQDVSAGKCVAEMISPPQQHTSFPKLFPPVLPSQTWFIVLAFLGFWNTHATRGSGTCRKSRLLRHSLARPGPWLIFAFLDHSAESVHCFWLETWTAEIRTVLLADVLGLVDVAVCQDKTCSSKGFCITLRVLLFT